MQRNNGDSYNMEEKAREAMPAGSKTVVATLAVNAQSYDAPVQVSNSTSRVVQLFPFNPKDYNNVSASTTANIVFNTGTAMVNAPTSSVLVTINFSGTLTRDSGGTKYLCWSFGDNIGSGNIGGSTLKSGSSACNLFNQILLKARGGQIPAQVIDSNVLAAAIAPWQKGIGAEYLGSETGSASLTTYRNTKATLNQPKFEFPMYYCADSITLEIPLSKLVPGSVFGQQSPLLGQFISGSTLSLRFENMLRAMVFYESTVAPLNGKPPVLADCVIADVPTNYNTVRLNVNDMNLLADCMTITDSSLSALNSKCRSLSSSGCQYQYNGVYQTSTTLNSSSASINVLISAAELQTVVVSFLKPASLADGMRDAFARLPLVNFTGAEDGTAIFKGSAGAAGNVVGKLGINGSCRIRLGNEYQTLAPIQSAGQLFRQTYQSLCSVKDGLLNDTDFLHRINKPVDINTSFEDWYYGSGATSFAFDLTKTPIVGNSGSVTNNSRSVIIDLQGLAAGSGAAAIECFIHCFYMNVANISLENVIVDM